MVSDVRVGDNQRCHDAVVNAAATVVIARAASEGQSTVSRRQCCYPLACHASCLLVMPLPLVAPQPLVAPLRSLSSGTQSLG